MPKDDTTALLNDIRGYFSKHPFKGFPSDADQKVSYIRLPVPQIRL